VKVLVSRIVVVEIVEVATCIVWIVLVVEPLTSSGVISVLLLERLLGMVELLVGVRILELSALIVGFVILLEICRLL
jgi:hypothetical protein